MGDTFMKYIIFLILIACIIALYFYSNLKITNLRSKLLALKRQNSNLSSNLSTLNKQNSSLNNINIMPSTVNNSSGIIKSLTNVYIGPLDALPIIYTTNVNMEVSIFDKVQSNNEFWYYVELPKDSKINSRGWIKETNFTVFQNPITNIIRHF